MNWIKYKLGLNGDELIEFERGERKAIEEFVDRIDNLMKKEIDLFIDIRNYNVFKRNLDKIKKEMLE